MLLLKYDRMESAVQIRFAARMLVLRNVHVTAYVHKNRLFYLGQDRFKGLSAQECTHDCTWAQ